jgi:hypothetical protein
MPAALVFEVSFLDTVGSSWQTLQMSISFPCVVLVWLSVARATNVEQRGRESREKLVEDQRLVAHWAKGCVSLHLVGERTGNASVMFPTPTTLRVNAGVADHVQTVGGIAAAIVVVAASH